MSTPAADFVERQYNLRAAFPDHVHWFARWAADSEAARSTLEVHRHVRYGSGPKQTLDLFPAAHPRAALLFIHGGYWRSLDKDDHSFVAPPFVAQGVGVAVINYDLCPDVSMVRIVDQCRQALLWLHREGARFGVPAQRLFVAGHSAGGHLTAMLFATDWSGYGVAPAMIAGGLALSGVFDLEPLLHVSFNADLRLDAGKAQALSPIHVAPQVRAPLLLAAGEKETGEFIRQSWLLWQRWPECRPDGMDGPLFVPERNHFAVLSDIVLPQSKLFAATLHLFDHC